MRSAFARHIPVLVVQPALAAGADLELKHLVKQPPAAVRTAAPDHHYEQSRNKEKRRKDLGEKIGRSTLFKQEMPQEPDGEPKQQGGNL